MGRRLTGYTIVRDENLTTHTFGPGDDVPEWAAKQILNPALWGEQRVETPAAPAIPEEEKPRRGRPRKAQH